MAGRKCTVSCYGPWSPNNTPCFVRVNFSFPTGYPYTKALRTELTCELGIRNRAVLMRGLRTIAHGGLRSGTPGLDLCLRFLLGERVPSDGIASRDGSSESEDDTSPGGNVGVNVPTPRQCSASFGPNGAQYSPVAPRYCLTIVSDQLVYFFARPLRVRAGAPSDGIRHSLSASPHTLLRSAASTVPHEASDPPRKRRRVFESFGVLPLDRKNDDSGEEATESDELLRNSGVVLTTVSRSQYCPYVDCLTSGIEP